MEQNVLYWERIILYCLLMSKAGELELRIYILLDGEIMFNMKLAL